MPSKLIGAEITGIEDKDKKIDGKDSNFVKKAIPVYGKKN